MHKVKNADYEEYRKYRDDVQTGKIITFDQLKSVCELCNGDTEKIGQYFLDKYNALKTK